jgi:hypothetical protein
MRSIFKKVIWASAIVATAALTANSALASTTVYVPFSFAVAGKILPAGSYQVERDSSGSFVTLESQRLSQTFTWILGPGLPDPNDRKIALRFEGRDSTHVLESIQYGSKVTPKLNKAKSDEHASERVSQSW